MQQLEAELRRLGRGVATDQGRRRAARLHLGLLALALLFASTSRTLGPWPGAAALEGRVVPTLLAALALYLSGFLLHGLWTRGIRPDLRRLAERLDDEQGWRDDTGTAMGLPRGADRARVPRVLLTQATGRVRALDEAVPGEDTRAWRRTRLVLVLLFAFVLLAPGVDGLLGERGAGQGEATGLGRTPLESRFGPPPPMDADWFLSTFVENPLPVEALPPEPADGEEGR